MDVHLKLLDVLGRNHGNPSGTVGDIGQKPWMSIWNCWMHRSDTMDVHQQLVAIRHIPYLQSGNVEGLGRYHSSSFRIFRNIGYLTITSSLHWPEV
jgi:hypothetical protein